MGAEALDVDIMSYFELGAARRVASILLDNSLDKLMVTSEPFSLAGHNGFKAVDLHLRGLPKFTAKDYGGYLPLEAGF